MVVIKSYIVLMVLFCDKVIILKVFVFIVVIMF